MNYIDFIKSKPYLLSSNLELAPNRWTLEKNTGWINTMNKATNQGLALFDNPNKDIKMVKTVEQYNKDFTPLVEKMEIEEKEKNSIGNQILKGADWAGMKILSIFGIDENTYGNVFQKIMSSAGTLTFFIILLIIIIKI